MGLKWFDKILLGVVLSIPVGFALSACYCALFVSLDEQASQLPKGYYQGNLEYNPPGPKLNVSRDAAAKETPTDIQGKESPSGRHQSEKSEGIEFFPSIPIGIQVSLPSGWYQSEDIQYFPPGPEFERYREVSSKKRPSKTRGETIE